VNVRDSMNEPQPISKISGNIEITFNTKGKNLDPYEPWMDQIVLTIGKSGRANRLTFNDLDSDSIYGAAETLKEIADQVKDIEDMLEEAENQEFDIDDIEKIESGLSYPEKVIKKTLNAIKELEKEKKKSIFSVETIAKQLEEHNKEEVEAAVDDLKKQGEVFQPNSKEPMEIQKL